MNRVGQGFLARSFLGLNGFIVARGFESGTGTIIVPPVVTDVEVPGRRDVEVYVDRDRGPCVLTYIEEPERVCSPLRESTATSVRGPGIGVYIAELDRVCAPARATTASACRAPRFNIFQAVVIQTPSFSSAAVTSRKGPETTLYASGAKRKEPRPKSYASTRRGPRVRGNKKNKRRNR